MEKGESLNLLEVETALSRFTVCPKCGSHQGFWLGIKSERPYVHCKSCGTRFELFGVYSYDEKDHESRRLGFLKR